jgi:hypothetical protein
MSASPQAKLAVRSQSPINRLRVNQQTAEAIRELLSSFLVDPQLIYATTDGRGCDWQFLTGRGVLEIRRY